ncbi:MAG: uracil-DNA glycosylase [Pseudomonadota bacterium]
MTRLNEPEPAAVAPNADCQLCPRLATFRDTHRNSAPEWFNAPVPSFGDVDGEFLVVGLAPGLKGANRTGRPFTGDYAGDLLYATLGEFGFSRGSYAARADDGLELTNCLITNAVRCVPPQNKPTGPEINTCRSFLRATVTSMVNLKCILALGRIAHESVVVALECRKSAFPFRHGARHEISAYTLIDSFHCSRYNTNTKRLTEDMFRSVFHQIRDVITP